MLTIVSLTLITSTLSGHRQLMMEQIAMLSRTSQLMSVLVICWSSLVTLELGRYKEGHHCVTLILISRFILYIAEFFAECDPRRTGPITRLLQSDWQSGVRVSGVVDLLGDRPTEHPLRIGIRRRTMPTRHRSLRSAG